jgi:membrane protease YdiL (CAAX protease family)
MPTCCLPGGPATTGRQQVVLAAPVLVPLSMAAVFRALKGRMPAPRAYNVGFVIYWAGWGVVFPLLILGRRETWRWLCSGSRPGVVDWTLLAVPVAGAVSQALLPNRRRVTPLVGCVMLASAAVNAVCEELLWRGVFMAEFGQDVVRGSLWPLAGFSLWHFAPQIVLPAEMGRWRFVMGAGVVGAGSAVTAWRGRGLRWTVLPHMLTDACGVRAAEFRLGRMGSS